MDERNYEVYRHTSLTNGKVYIGAGRLGWETRWESKYGVSLVLIDTPPTFHPKRKSYGEMGCVVAWV